jgi:tetratricopeptide (TPR) repeat protein
MTLGRLARSMHTFSPPAETVAMAREAVDLAGDDALVRSQALTHLWFAMQWAEYRTERIEVAKRLIDEGVRHGFAYPEFWGRVYRMNDLMESGDLAGIAAEVERFERRSRRLYLPMFQWVLPLRRASAAHLAGRFDEAEEHIAILGDVVEMNARAPELLYAFARLLLAWERGDPDALARADELAAPLGDFLKIARDSVQVFALASAGRSDDARALVEQIPPEDFRTLPHGLTWLGMLGLFAETCTILHDAARCEVLYEEMLPFAEHIIVINFVSPLLSCEHFLGTMAAVLGRTGDAIAHLERALRKHTAMNAPPLVARTQCELGRVLVAAGDARGRQLLERAGCRGARVGPGGARRGARAGEADAGRAGDDRVRRRAGAG